MFLAVDIESLVDATRRDATHQPYRNASYVEDRISAATDVQLLIHQANAGCN